MSTLRKILCVCVMAAVLVMAFPVSSLAVDPVSAATMANAFAQAVTAYGASHGVSMTFDVANTDGIGEGVKELWDNFKADMESNSDYSGPVIQSFDSMSVSTWATLYKKIGDKVGFDLSSEIVSVFDGFWNWLLSGPAEMVKVDDQYYEWTLVNGAVAPIPVISTIDPSINGYSLVSLPVHRGSQDGSLSNTFTASVDTVYCLPLYNSSNNYKYMVMVNLVNQNFQYYSYSGSSASWASPNSGWYYVSIAASSDMYFDFDGSYYPTINSSTTPNTYFGPYDSDNIEISESGISVQPYVGAAVPENVYIPDNEDVNYQPIPAPIPLDFNWDASKFGDGSDTLTDAQAKEIADALDNAITDNPAKTLELADPVDPPLPGTEVYIPLLPVNLPSFNFSLSGIWHYVVSWVQSLGAWLSLMFQTWAVLPSAITIPVYATAVIVVVLGVYKRFFM